MMTKWHLSELAMSTIIDILWNPDREKFQNIIEISDYFAYLSKERGEMKKGDILNLPIGLPPIRLIMGGDMFFLEGEM